MEHKGITSSSSSSFEYHKFENDDKKRNEIFHIRIIVKHTNVDTFSDSGSQVNLISEFIVKKLALKVEPHVKPYPLDLVQKDT